MGGKVPSKSEFNFGVSQKLAVATLFSDMLKHTKKQYYYHVSLAYAHASFLSLGDLVDQDEKDADGTHALVFNLRPQDASQGAHGGRAKGENGRRVGHGNRLLQPTYVPPLISTIF